MYEYGAEEVDLGGLLGGCIVQRSADLLMLSLLSSLNIPIRSCSCCWLIFLPVQAVLCVCVHAHLYHWIIHGHKTQGFIVHGCWYFNLSVAAASAPVYGLHYWYLFFLDIFVPNRHIVVIFWYRLIYQMIMGCHGCLCLLASFVYLCVQNRWTRLPWYFTVGSNPELRKNFVRDECNQGRKLAIVHFLKRSVEEKGVVEDARGRMWVIDRENDESHAGSSWVFIFVSFN